ncbi:hypothetical protein TNCV_3675891 [Trichonephila clavipes]|nr:hypothetical protein TNCV_3675891 [Trichonephila clavipes]
MWPRVAQRLTQITPPAATTDQLWQRVEAAWSDVPQEHMLSLFESMPRRVEAFLNGSLARGGPSPSHDTFSRPAFLLVSPGLSSQN